MGYLSLLVFATGVHAQSFLRQTPKAKAWVDSVYSSLTPDQRITQLMVIRESGIQDGQPDIYTEKVSALVKKYNIGAICLFQGAPNDQALVLRRLQQEAQTPLLVTIDAETGLGMRMTGVEKFPDQLTLGAMRHSKALVYQIGSAMAEQCHRMGIQVNYAPVVDINNNPDNPVIGYRSFGQNKRTVTAYGTAIMKGLQDNGIMACAKHFPGHGDVSVDSHLDLPVIEKSLAELDTLELVPFKKIFKAGIGSVMIAHLSIPEIDSTPHLASSLSPKFVTDILRKKLGFKGLSFTDALEMKGVAKYYPQGEVAAMSLIAGNDMLCLPGDIPVSLEKINAALKDGRLTWPDLEKRVKKVLYAKYNLGLRGGKTGQFAIDTAHLEKDLNRQVHTLNVAAARQALTAVRLASGKFEPIGRKQKVAYLQIGGNASDLLGKKLKEDIGAKGFYFGHSDNAQMAEDILNDIKGGKFDRIVLILEDYSKRPADNFMISSKAIKLLSDLQYNDQKAMLVLMGNPYAIKNFTQFKNLITTYQDGPAFQEAAFNFLTGKSGASGSLPVTVAPDLPFGTGLIVKRSRSK